MKKVFLLTGGKDRPYVIGLTSGLLETDDFGLDIIGSDYMQQGTDVFEDSRVNFLKFREDTDPSLIVKATRTIKLYMRLIKRAFLSDCKLFHIIWLNKFEVFDRIFLHTYYKLLRKKLIFTAHNVDAGLRDGKSSLINKASLFVLYHMVDHIIVHTEKMKTQLASMFKVRDDKISVIRMGLYNEFPMTAITRRQSRERLGLDPDTKILLFFGYIASYKGIEFLLEALKILLDKGEKVKLIIAGQIKPPNDEYWATQEAYINQHNLNEHILKKIDFIPDEDVELYFKSADLLILPYKYIFRPAFLLVSYAYGLPAVATDVGSLKEDIVDGETGFISRPADPQDIADKIRQYFDSELYRDQDTARERIKKFGNDRYSWSKIGAQTAALYRRLLGD